MMQRIGRYEVLDHLASGGMGHVYLARMTGVGGFERQVVVKALEVDDPDDDGLVTMFLDEARLLGALHHHYIAPVYEVGCDVDGRYFLVMDYVNGETVEAVWRASVERGPAIPLAFALTVVSAIAAALDYAHALRTPAGEPLGIVHRDVSLSNIMIGFDGAVKLIDFGIAKAANRATQTQAGALKGKIGYLAPEQVLHKHVDHRADIFALGIVLYELTTMARAFRDRSDLNTYERIAAGQVTPPSQVVADYPPELERIVMKALAVDPADRFQDAGSMGRALEALAHRDGLQLGHAVIAGRMRALFDRSRRRFARASSELALPSSAPPAAPHVIDDVATAPMDLPADLEPTTEPRMMPVEEAASMVPPAAPPPPAAWPRRVPVTVTAEIVRPAAMRGLAEPAVRSDPAALADPAARTARRLGASGWLIFCALVATLVAIVIALA